MHKVDNNNISEDAKYSSSEYRRLNLLLGQSSTSSFNKNVHLTSPISVSQPVQTDMQTYVSTEPSSNAGVNLQSCSSIYSYQQCLSRHIDEQEELLTTTNLVPNTFLPQILIEYSNGVVVEPIDPCNVSCCGNESQTYQRTDSATQLPGNISKPSHAVDSLVLEDNVSLPYNCSSVNSTGLQEPNPNNKQCCTSDSQLVSTL